MNSNRASLRMKLEWMNSNRSSLRLKLEWNKLRPGKIELAERYKSGRFRECSKTRFPEIIYNLQFCNFGSKNCEILVKAEGYPKEKINFARS